MKPRHAVIIGLVGLMSLGVGALVAWAHQAPLVIEAPPSELPPLKMMTMKDVWMSFARTMKPYQPPPPMQLTIPREQARDEILAEVRRLCLVLKKNRVTAMQLAQQIGADLKLYDYAPGTIDFHSKNPYFSRGRISRSYDAEFELTEMSERLWLELTDPRLLLAPEIEKALGPHSGLNTANAMDSWDPNALDLVWSEQPRGQRECHIVVYPEWGHHYYGMKENPVHDIQIELWDYE